MRITTGRSAVLFMLVAVVAACSDNNVPTAPVQSAPDAINGLVQSNTNTIPGKHVRIVRATGDITASVNEYRDLLGPLNPNTAGEKASGRREINWDGVPAAVTDNDAFPGNFFNVNSPRGVLFSTNGFGFRTSSKGYADVNAEYAGEFNTFSPTKLFVARGSTVIDVQFVVAGSNTPAVVTGFGSVFADVGRAHSTTIEFFDARGRSLLTITAPRRSDNGGLSFAGAVFDEAIVARVRITAGDTPVDAAAFDNVKGAGRKFDIVATDDFIYGEPHQSN